MALTSCYECGGTISTKATVCPHCGAPLEQTGEYSLSYDGETMDATQVIKLMYSKNGSIKSAIWDMCDKVGIPEDDKTISGFIYQIYELFKKKYGYEPEHLELIIPPSEEEILQREYEQQLLEQARAKKQQPHNTPRCPTCGSENLERLSFGTKAAASIMFGFSSSTARGQFLCKNCGYKW